MIVLCEELVIMFIAWEGGGEEEGNYQTNCLHKRVLLALHNSHCEIFEVNTWFYLLYHFKILLWKALFEKWSVQTGISQKASDSLFSDPIFSFQIDPMPLETRT